jgi:hypothetical protein
MTGKDIAFACPTCGSGALTLPTLAGTDYICAACGWKGRDALIIPVQGSGEESFRSFSSEVLLVLAKYLALPLGKILVHWGFVPTDNAGKPSAHYLAQYLHAMSKAVVTALIEERKKIEIEKARNGTRS